MRDTGSVRAISPSLASDTGSAAELADRPPEPNAAATAQRPGQPDLADSNAASVAMPGAHHAATAPAHAAIDGAVDHPLARHQPTAATQSTEQLHDSSSGLTPLSHGLAEAPDGRNTAPAPMHEGPSAVSVDSERANRQLSAHRGTQTSAHVEGSPVSTSR